MGYVDTRTESQRLKGKQIIERLANDDAELAHCFRSLELAVKKCRKLGYTRKRSGKSSSWCGFEILPLRLLRPVWADYYGGINCLSWAKIGLILKMLGINTLLAKFMDVDDNGQKRKRDSTCLIVDDLMHLSVQRAKEKMVSVREICNRRRAQRKVAERIARCYGIAGGVPHRMKVVVPLDAMKIEKIASEVTEQASPELSVPATFPPVERPRPFGSRAYGSRF